MSENSCRPLAPPRLRCYSLGMTEDKKTLRRRMAGMLLQLSGEERRAASSAACRSFVQSPLFAQSDAILCYMAAEQEISPEEIMHAAAAAGKSLAVPLCIPHTNRLRFLCVDAAASGERWERQFVRGAWGLLEPDEAQCPPFSAASFAGKSVCVLVPGVAFSAAGLRLGHGKGYYDSFLAELCAEASSCGCSVQLVGMCFSCQLLPSVPAEAHDVPVQFLLTEQGLSPCIR